MTTRSPWYITRTAILDYHRISTGSTSDPDDEQFDAAKEALLEALRSAHFVGGRRNGLELWRLQGQPRLRLLLATAPHTRGVFPQLVRVLPEHD